MASKYCTTCYQRRLLPSFLADTSNPEGKFLNTCIKCRARRKRSYKRKALQPLDPNVPSKRPAIANTKPTEAPLIPLPYVRSKTRPEPSIHPLPPPESRPETPLPIPPIPKSRLEAPLLPPPSPPPPPPPIQPTGFLPPDQWRLIQDFHTALDGVKMEYCVCCQEQWFSMGLKDNICHVCFLRDKGS